MYLVFLQVSDYTITLLSGAKRLVSTGLLHEADITHGITILLEIRFHRFELCSHYSLLNKRAILDLGFAFPPFCFWTIPSPLISDERA